MGNKQILMKFLPVFAFLLLVQIVSAQPVADQLKLAIDKFEKDEQLKHGSISLYVVNAATGAPVFDRNALVGMAPASSQKVITSVTAFEILGKDYRYKTTLGYKGNVVGNQLQGALVLTASGDPTLGSWRWLGSSEKNILQSAIESLQQKNIAQVSNGLLVDMQNWESQATPRGWTWEDMGNYYGAGAWALNWHENQYDLILQPGKAVGDAVKILKTTPILTGVTNFYNELTTGASNSGDQAIIYLPAYGTVGFVRGTVPAGKETFTIKGALPLPYAAFRESFLAAATAKGMRIDQPDKLVPDKNIANLPLVSLLKIESPAFDSMNYWFLRESLNLYGEAFIKTIALQQKGFAATDSGLAILRYFWSSRGIDKAALKMVDGSGLSPANRTTAHALVTVLQYARNKAWYPSFYNALPLMNGIKMKSGYISGVRSYTGYIKSRAGVEYTFAFIVNNFDGSAGSVREKMWKLLDILK